MIEVLSQQIVDPRDYREVIYHALKDSHSSLEIESSISKAREKGSTIIMVKTDDLISLMKEKWEFRTLDDKNDIRRVNVIKDKIMCGTKPWPYVSYWANDLQKLFEVGPDGDINHGDGWHRLHAFQQLGIETCQILFL